MLTKAVAIGLILCMVWLVSLSYGEAQPLSVKLQDQIRLATVDAQRNLYERLVGVFIAGSSSPEQVEYIIRSAPGILEGYNTETLPLTKHFVMVKASISKATYLENLRKGTDPSRQVLLQFGNFLPDTIEAIGYAPLSREGLTYLKARRAALMDAMRKVAAACCGEVITQELDVTNFVLTHSDVRSKLEGFQYIQGLEIFEETKKSGMIILNVKMNFHWYKAFVDLVLTGYQPEKLERFLEEIAELPEPDITATGTGLIK